MLSTGCEGVVRKKVQLPCEVCANDMVGREDDANISDALPSRIRSLRRSKTSRALILIGGTVDSAALPRMTVFLA